MYKKEGRVKLRPVRSLLFRCASTTKKKRKKKQQHQCCLKTKPHKSSLCTHHVQTARRKKRGRLGPSGCIIGVGVRVWGKRTYTLSFSLPNPPNTITTPPPSSSATTTPTMASRIAAAAKGIRFASHAHASAANPWLAERIAIKEHAGRMFVFKLLIIW